MEARIQNDGDVCVVHLKGRVDMEANENFRKTCLGSLAVNKIVFDMRELSFVGSNGITPFIETFALLSQRNVATIKVCGLGCEFRRIFEASGIQNLEIYENEGTAKRSFHDQSVRPLNPIVDSTEDLENPV